MASAHGAGLMLLPVLMAQPMSGMTHSMAGGTSAIPSSLTASAIGFAVLIHTASMLAVAGILAIAFFETYEKVGLQLLRHTWLNFDLLWAIALLVAGFVVLFF
jgi:cation transport ATPase